MRYFLLNVHELTLTIPLLIQAIKKYCKYHNTVSMAICRYFNKYLLIIISIGSRCTQNMTTSVWI